MPSSRIFVSYVCLGDEPGARIGKQLLTDIRAAKTEAVSDHETISDERFLPFLTRELPHCGYLIVVQTPAALQSWRVQRALALAHVLSGQRQLQVIRVIAVPSPSADQHPSWAALTTFDASIDYPRVREQLLLTLGLTRLDVGDSFVFEQPVLLSPPPPLPIGGYPPAQQAGRNRPELSAGRPPQPSIPPAFFHRIDASSGAGVSQGQPVPPMGSASSPASQHTSVFSRIWSLVQAFFVRLWRMVRRSIAAVPGLSLREDDETVILRPDHPQSLNK